MLAIDHLVFAAVNPKQAAEEFAEKHKIKVIKGGKHELWGTYNYLAYFSNDSYIEWIGIFDEEIANQSTNPLIQQLVDQLNNSQEGFFQFALRTERTAQYVEHFKQKNIPFTGPIAGQRKKVDGSTLKWSMLFSEQMPFLIEWGKVRNTPDQPQLINNKQLVNVTLNSTCENQFNHVFNTKSHDHIIKLANGTLNFSIKKELDFSFN